MRLPTAIALAAGLVLESAPVLADGDAANAVGRASATLVNPIAIQPLQGLYFGVVTAAAGTSGTVVVVPGAPEANYTGGVRRACTAGCMPHGARFVVFGEAGRSYRITVPDSLAASAELPSSPSESPGNPAASGLRIDTIRLKTASRPDAGPVGQTNNLGRDHFFLGGTLQVPAETAPAHYQANLPVIMAYD